MKNILEKATTTDSEYIVRFVDGEIYQLKELERVDESIYQNRDTFVGVIVAKVNGKKALHPGSLMEFSVKDVAAVEEVVRTSC